MKNRPKGLVYKPRKTKIKNAYCKNCGLFFEYEFKGKTHLYCSDECKKAKANSLYFKKYWQKNKDRINEKRRLKRETEAGRG